jgi:S1-C subfamily serine protease
MNFFELKIISKEYDSYVKFLEIILFDVFPIAKTNPNYVAFSKNSEYLNGKHSRKLSNDGLCFTQSELLGSLATTGLIDYANLRSFDKVRLFLRLLNEKSILHKSVFQADVFCVTHDFVKYLGSLKRVSAYTLGFTKILENTRNSVFAIEVKNAKGDLGIGTGFYFGYLENGILRSLIITNKHVVENNEIIRVISEFEQEITYKSIHKCSKDIDLACIEVDNDSIVRIGSETISFYNDGIDTLDDVITIGYPDVPNREKLTLLAHRGQINGLLKIRNSESNYLVISAKTSPGNSGGPVINEMGKIVGIVTESGESITIYDKGSPAFDRFFYAIPTETIMWFLNEEVLPTL